MSVSAEKLQLKPPGRERLDILNSIKEIGHGFEKATDDRGHLIADQFNGNNTLANLVPMDSKINQGSYKVIEQMKIPSTKTEHRAVNALEVIIDNHSTMEHQFNENDKEMSWDGYIWLYKNNNGDQSKTNFDARVNLNTKISDYTEEQHMQFLKRVNLRLGAYNKQLNGEINRYNWKCGEKIYPLLIYKKDGQIELASSLYTNRFSIFLPKEDGSDERGYKMPLFIYKGADVLSNLYFYDYDSFYKQIDDSDINEITVNAFIECSLILINVYDMNSDVHFLDLADYILNKLEPFVQKDVFLLNKMEIKKRKKDLEDEEKILI